MNNSSSYIDQMLADLDEYQSHRVGRLNMSSYDIWKEWIFTEKSKKVFTFNNACAIM